MAKFTLLSVAAASCVTLASVASAQNSYPADMSGVDMAAVPATDLCQLDGNEAVTEAGQALVSAEILERGLICDGLVGLGATNLGVIVPVAATTLLVGLAAAAGGGTNGTTSDTQ